MVGDARRRLDEGDQLLVGGGVGGDVGVRPPRADGVERADQFSLKSSDSEFMQYRSPVGVWYASSNRWPRCEPQVPQTTSVRVMPSEVSVLSSTASGLTASNESGQRGKEADLAQLG